LYFIIETDNSSPLYSFFIITSTNQNKGVVASRGNGSSRLFMNTSPRAAALPPIDWVSLGKQGLEISDLDGDDCSVNGGTDEPKCIQNKNSFMEPNHTENFSAAIVPHGIKGTTEFVRNSSIVPTATLKQILLNIISYLPLVASMMIRIKPTTIITILNLT